MATSTRVRVLVLTRDVAFARRLSQIAADDARIDLAGSTRVVREALDLLRQLSVDVVLVDQGSPLTGVACCRAVRSLGVDAAVLVVAAGAPDDVLYACLRAGARGILVKEPPHPGLADAVVAAAGGHVVLSGEVTDRLVRWLRGDPGGSRDELTPHEIELIACVGAGLSNRQIGQRIHLSEHTVKARLGKVMRKLGARKRREAVRAAIRRGVL